MRITTFLSLTLVASLVLAGCGGGEVQTGNGATTDVVDNDTPTVPDTIIDTTTSDTVSADNAVPADTAGDSAPDVADDTTFADTTPDATPDVVADTTTPDVPEEVAEEVVDDVAPEATPDVDEVSETVETACTDGTIAGLLACTETTVDVALTSAVVTYVFPGSFFLYDASTTRGIQVYETQGAAWTFTPPVVGDTVSLHVTKLTDFSGQQEITGCDNLVVINQTGDVATLDLNGTPSPEPSEDLESRAVTGEDLLVSRIVCDEYVEVAYGTLTDVTLRAFDPIPLCAGATLDLASGVITDYKGEHRLHTFKDGDITDVVATGCTAPDHSNFGFEEDTGTDDPPADFYKATCSFTAVRDTTKKFSGDASCALTWASTTRQDLFMSEFVAKGENTKANLTVLIQDSDIHGRARPAVAFYDADKKILEREYCSTYSANMGANDWQQLEIEAAFPEGAVYARGFVVMYDEGTVSGQPPVGATVNIDDWTFTVHSL